MHQPQGCRRGFLIWFSFNPVNPIMESFSISKGEEIQSKGYFMRLYSVVQLIYLCLHMLCCLKLNYQLCWKWHFRNGKNKWQFLDLMCSPKLLQGSRLHHLRTSTRLGWRLWIDWILFILFTSHLRWSPRPLLHSWQPMRPASVSDKDEEISRPRLSEVKYGEEEKIRKIDG